VRSRDLDSIDMLTSPRFRLLVAAVLLSLAAAITAGCGDGGSDEGLLSRERAARLQEALDGVEAASEAGDCGAAQTEATEFEERVQSLPQGTEADLRSALESGARHLQALIDDRCAPDEPAPQTEEPPPTETTPQEEDQEQDKQPPGQERKEDKQKKDEGQGGDGGQGPPPEEQIEPPVTDEQSGATGGSGE
jgi:outer membrane biosynthesis protein TonB